jgi:leucyl-tRNA synthetase
MDPHNGLAFADKKLADYWKQVDLYIGGSEHATGHLLYVRFWTKILNDLGHIAIDEPVKKLINQGMIQGTSAYTNIISKINFINLPNEVNKHFLIYVSKNKLKEIISTNNTSFIKDIYQKHYVSIDFSKTNFEFDKQSSNNGVGKRAVLVDYINPNDTLQFDNFKKWRDVIYKEAGLIVEYVFEDDGSFVVEREVEKMSKSKWNVVTPDDIAEKFGSDTLRLYEMFLGPLEQSKPWNTNGITGVHGFLKKLWRLFYQNDAFTITTEEPTKAELKTLHKTIKKITEDIERFSFNTSVSNFMICVNELTDLKCNKKEILEPLLICLSPYAPHITEELWKQLGHIESIAFAPFPLVNEAFLIDDSINYPVSVNGKLKFTLELPATLTKEEVEVEVMKNEQTIKLLAGQQPKKVIVVHKKIVNMVV